jgi:hypothetical protein
MHIGVLMLAAAAVLLADGSLALGQVPDSWLGTWKVNVAKSTYHPGPGPKASVVIWEAVGNSQYRITTESVNASGVTTRNEIVTRLDGAEAPVSQSNPAPGTTQTRAYKRIDDSGYEYVTRVNGKVTTTSRMVYARDGKTRTMTTTGTNLQGQSISSVIVYERQ